MVTTASGIPRATLCATFPLVLYTAVSLLLLLPICKLYPCSSDLLDEVTGFVLLGSPAPNCPQGGANTWARDSSNLPDDEDYDEDNLEPVLSEDCGCRPWGSARLRLRPSRRNYGLPNRVQP